MKLINYKKGFTLIELIIGMTIGAIVMISIGTFLMNYYENSLELKKIQSEHTDIILGLKSIQKIIFENGKYFTFNSEVFNSGDCSGSITDGIGIGNLCHTKFGFVVENEGGLEENYSVELIDCPVGVYNGKQLVYKNSNNIIPLLSNCIYNKSTIPIEHEIEIINDNIKEKVFRYIISTENGSFQQTFFVH